MGPVDRCRLGPPHPDLQVLECEIHCHAPVVAARTWMAMNGTPARLYGTSLDSTRARRRRTRKSWSASALRHPQLQNHRPGVSRESGVLRGSRGCPSGARRAQRAAVRACSKATTEPLAGARSGEQTWNAGRNDGLLHYAQPCHEAAPSALKARTHAKCIRRSRRRHEGEMPRKAARRDALPRGKYHQATSRWC